jgi:hypothetical protein
MPVASRDVYTDITEGLFLLRLPHESQLLASAGSSSSLTQSSLDFVPPAFPLYIESNISLIVNFPGVFWVQGRNPTRD